jgi:hypothetical protein
MNRKFDVASKFCSLIPFLRFQHLASRFPGLDGYIWDILHIKYNIKMILDSKRLPKLDLIISEPIFIFRLRSMQIALLHLIMEEKLDIHLMVKDGQSSFSRQSQAVDSLSPKTLIPSARTSKFDSSSWRDHHVAFLLQ